MKQGRTALEREGAPAAAFDDGGSKGLPRPFRRVAARPVAPDPSAGPMVAWSAIGHELRTPMNAILGGVELLLDGSTGPLSADARACLGDVQVAARQLMRRIDWLMLLAQVNAATSPRHVAVLDLAGLVRAALASAPAMEDGDTRPCEEGAFLVRGDGFWLEVLAQALAEVCRSREEAGTPRLQTWRTREDGRSGVGLVWSGAAPWVLPPVPWSLIGAIVALHGGEVTASEGSLWLIWPRACVVSA